MFERINVKLLGRTLGTASGWDGDPGEQIWFEDFLPKEGLALPTGQLGYSALEGLIGLTYEDGAFKEAFDVVSFLHGVPRDV